LMNESANAGEASADAIAIAITVFFMIIPYMTVEN